MNRTETPHRPVEAIAASEFAQGVAYTNWRPRGSGDWLLIHTVSGAGEIRAPETAFVLGPGEAVLFAPGVMQDYRTHRETGRWRLLWAHFQPRPHWRPWLRWPEATRGIGRITLPAGAPRAGLADALRRAVRVLRHPRTDSAEFALNALEEALLWTNTAARGAEQLDPRIRGAMDYLAAHPEEPFRLNALAARCGLSGSRFSHLFKDETGVTPQRFAEEARLRQAQQLLAYSSLRVHEVAAQTGFDDAFYFAKRFRRFAGRSPTEYRRREASA